MEDQDVEAKVREALENASVNGYDFDGWRAMDICIDMCTYDADLENIDAEILLPIVQRITGKK